MPAANIESEYMRARVARLRCEGAHAFRRLEPEGAPVFGRLGPASKIPTIPLPILIRGYT